MNRFDDVRLNVRKLLEEQTSRLPQPDPVAASASRPRVRGRLTALARLYGTGLLIKTGLYKRLVHANLKLDWFYEFQDYWVNELGNRPIQPHDFYFLHGVYRQRIQNYPSEEEQPSGAIPDEVRIEAWQDPRVIYYLFAWQYRLALQPLRAHRFVKYLHRNGNICEYGCGAAPISTSLVKYYPHLALKITCVDIPHIVFHFSRWKFRSCPYVRMVAIQPGNDTPLDDQYDAIFCLEVFEHLPRPLAAVRHFESCLKPRGYLVFDYVRSEGKGLDTATGLRDRLEVLRYIRDRFRTIEGEIHLDGRHVSTTVVQKP
jgi:2-polyprenyl-3-methyl-5-hydroxy-6-metoxy-1,4-benzoquinol methylase